MHGADEVGGAVHFPGDGVRISGRDRTGEAGGGGAEDGGLHVGAHGLDELGQGEEPVAEFAALGQDVLDHWRGVEDVVRLVDDQQAQVSLLFRDGRALERGGVELADNELQEDGHAVVAERAAGTVDEDNPLVLHGLVEIEAVVRGREHGAEGLVAEHLVDLAGHGLLGDLHATLEEQVDEVVALEGRQGVDGVGELRRVGAPRPVVEDQAQCVDRGVGDQAEEFQKVAGGGGLDRCPFG